MRRYASLLLFSFVSAGVWLLLSDRWEANNDEGRYLEGALRCYRGQAIYRDFFAITGPLTYWLSEWSFRLFGVTLSTARIPLALAFGAFAASVWSLSARFLPARAAALLTGVCLLFQVRYFYFFAVNHRWDSASFAIAALALILGADSRWRGLAAGACAAAAAWCTPTVGLAALPVAYGALRQGQIWAFLGGASLVTAICGGRILAEGSFRAMIECLTWTSTHYSSPNRVAYGWAGSGFAGGLDANGAVEWILFAVIALWMFLPAILPPLTAVAWGIRAARARSIDLRQGLLIATAAALFLSTLPRWDLGHLLYVTPIFYVAFAAAIPLTTLRRIALLYIPVVLLVGLPMLLPGRLTTVRTAHGAVRADAVNAGLLNFVLQHAPRNQPLFVFANTPSFYFFADSLNPTWYPFLEAGLTNAADEKRAIEQLSKQLPAVVIFQTVPLELYLKTSPNADPATLRFDLLEPFLKERYRETARLPDGRGDFSILVRK